MKLNIAVVASGPLIAGEIAGIIQSMLSENIDIQTYLTCEIEDSSIADIYICAQTQLKSLSQVVPKEKIVLLDLMPNSKFFIAVARIPKNETVYIFNNHLEYATILGNYCKNLGITCVEFVPIAYREMPQEEISARLQKAKYIIGVDRFVGEGGLLSPAYRPYLRKDVTIIPATRAASVHSACVLIQYIATKFYRHIADNIEKIKSDLQSNVSPAEADLKKIRLEVNDLVVSSNKALDIIQNAVTKSVLNNISSDVIIFDTHSNRLDIDRLANQPICDILEMIAGSNRTLHLIAEKLTKL
ncbi:hypothetical protein [Pelosinus sp. UFO1]|uniref:hypothetical protein n=1 Tax=Pelosinus sp. UFO1 TaxID=484770 RepID=UPI0004D1A098|nr:hypothetical protein [Pelosinus sp. UFO1]AIF50264.1 hypothetical protein UFO1_0709 [Pelosinus sp. UFO1]